MGTITTDVVVVGAGAAGMLATITARAHGLDAILVEATDLLGGSSALSDGAMWLPGNHVMTTVGEADTAAEAEEYLSACCGEPTPASTQARRQAYVESAPVLAHWLEELGLTLEVACGCPDSYPDQPGSKAQGRTLECGVTDAGVLGEWRQRCRFEDPLAIKGSEIPAMARSLRSFTSFLTAAKVIGARKLGGRITGKHLVGGGAALVTGLLKVLLESGAGLWREAPLSRLLTENGRVAGVAVTRNGHEMEIHTRYGVILTSGGFEKNQELRDRWLPQPSKAEWSSGSPGNQGGGLLAGLYVGAATDLLDEAWWAPTLMIRDQPHLSRWERALPHSMIVDATGDRFFNEAEPGIDAGHHMYQQRVPVPGVPAFLIMDNWHRTRYPLAKWLPGWTPLSAVQRGDIVKAESASQLAKKLGIDEAGLQATIAEISEFARKGKDRRFGRGESAFDHYYSDPGHKPNPSLGDISKTPLWGLPIYPGDLGTKGGLVTDEHARVLRPDGTPIAGLYAAGNVAASVMGRSYPGTGCSLGPALVFAYRAVLDIAADEATDETD